MRHGYDGARIAFGATFNVPSVTSSHSKRREERPGPGRAASRWRAVNGAAPGLRAVFVTGDAHGLASPAPDDPRSLLLGVVWRLQIYRELRRPACCFQNPTHVNEPVNLGDGCLRLRSDPGVASTLRGTSENHGGASPLRSQGPAGHFGKRASSSCDDDTRIRKLPGCMKQNTRPLAGSMSR
jgi:hypothetical protein